MVAQTGKHSARDEDARRWEPEILDAPWYLQLYTSKELPEQKEGNMGNGRDKAGRMGREGVKKGEEVGQGASRAHSGFPV